MGNRNRRWLRAVLIGSLMASSLAAAVPGQAAEPAGPTESGASSAAASISTDGRTRPPLPSGWFGRSFGIAGRSHVDAGEFIYEDYIYDDYGADSYAGDRTGGGETRFGLQKPRGDYLYPTNARFAKNSADIAELRVAARDDGMLHVLVRLNTLITADSTVVGVALDTDLLENDEPLAWPHAAGLTTPGSEHVLTMWGTGATWDGTAVGNFGADTVTNTIWAAIPIAQLGLTSGDRRVRLHAASGVWNGANWAPILPNKQPTDSEPAGGGPAVGSRPTARAFNVAFRNSEAGPWSDQAQAAALAAGDISQFSALVDLDAPDSEPALPTGVTPWVYRMSAALGEGVADPGIPGRGLGDYQGTTEFHFIGPDQRAFLYVPAQVSSATLVLHGGGGNAEQAIRGANLHTMLGEELESVLVSPEGLGPNCQWTDWAELAALDAVDDVQAAFGVPATTRAAVVGHSMGGLGVERLLVTRPDRFFAGAAFVANVQDDQRGEGDNPNGNPQNLFAGLRNTPLMFAHGVLDELEPYAEAYLAFDRLKQLGYMTWLQTFPYGDHLAPGALSQYHEARNFLSTVSGDTRARTERPAHVTFAMSEDWWRPDISDRLVFDRAWWVDDVRVRTVEGAAQFKSVGTVDAFSFALAAEDPALDSPLLPRAGAFAALASIVHEQNYVWPPEAFAADNRFVADLAGVSSVTFDVDAMALDEAQTLTAELTTDGPSDVLLKGSFVCPVVSGVPYELTSDGVVLHLAAGDHTVTISLDPSCGSSAATARSAMAVLGWTRRTPSSTAA